MSYTLKAIHSGDIAFFVIIHVHLPFCIAIATSLSTIIVSCYLQHMLIQVSFQMLVNADTWVHVDCGLQKLRVELIWALLLYLLLESEIHVKAECYFSHLFSFMPPS